MDVSDGPPDAKKQKLDEPADKTQTDQQEKCAVEDVKPESNDTDTSQASIDVSERVLSEIDVGITQYISQHKGFNGVIKQRYSDFLVNEISEDGRLVELTSTELPSPDSLGDSKVSEIDPTIICTEDIKKLEELAASKDKSRSVIIEVDDDKAARTKVHRAIAGAFPGLLDSTTISKEDKKFVEVKITSNKDNGLRKWPKTRGDYCKFVLYKENKDTMDTVGLIARQLGLKGSMFQYAGTKDKRAKTSQEVTVFRVQAEKLQNNNKRLRNIVTGNYSYVKAPLKLGQLRGNKFTIILRSVTGSANQIEEGMTSLREAGFINYYGMQRFGTSTIPTHHVGRQKTNMKPQGYKLHLMDLKSTSEIARQLSDCNQFITQEEIHENDMKNGALLLCDWKTAVELILKQRANDPEDVDAARKHWWKTRNSKETLQKMPKFQFIERAVLQGLADLGENDYSGALNKVARNTRLLYVHSYQSYIWNTAVSQRILKLGLKPVIGDLVLPQDVVHEDAEATEVQKDSSTKVKPVLITADNIDKYTIYDVVLPLPGYDVVYPDSVDELYKTLMEKDGIDHKSMRHKVKDYSLSGDYRHIVVQPKQVTWSTYKYTDVSIPLALSDWDKLNGEAEPQNLEDGIHTALKMEFTLPPSCYATMAIREVLKTDTSAAHQSSLNVT